MGETRSDLVMLAGRMLFGELLHPVNPPKAKDPNYRRYSIKFQVSKDSPEFETLWEKIHEVGERVWGAKAEEKLTNIAWCITSGIAAEKSDIGIQDGDLFSPEHNAGFWLIQATRKAGPKGGPVIRGLDGAVISDESQAPQGGDGVYVMVNVWCQPEYGRINLSLESVRKVIEGVPLGGGPSREELEAGNAALAAMPVPKAIPGVTPIAQLAARASAPAAPPAAPAVPANVGRKPLPGLGAKSQVVEAAPAVSETTTNSGALRRRGLANLD